MHTCRGISGLNDPSEAGSSQSRGGPGHGAANQTLRTHDLVSMAQQVLKAIIHLHRFGVIHKDVATRNCLVAEVPALGLNDRLHIQLCDAALSRDIFSDDYCTPADAEDNTSSRPIKWMAPEALRSNVFNSASDVVSFLDMLFKKLLKFYEFMRLILVELRCFHVGTIYLWSTTVSRNSI